MIIRWVKSVPNSEKWMCAGRQALWWLCQGYGPGLMVVNEYHPASSVRQRPVAGEVRVQRRGMLVALVHVPAGRVGLPDLHQLAPHRPAVAVQHAAAHHDALADRLAGAPDGQV